MRVFSEIRERVRALVFRSREDRELEEELAFHLEMAVEENLRRGMTPEEARRQAMLRLGGVTQVREATRAARGVRWLEVLGQDVRYALRGIRGNPLFASAFVLTLGLGIGAGAAMFAVVDALILRPLPYGEPERVVEVWSSDPRTMGSRPYLPRDFALEWAAHRELFEAAFVHARASALYTHGAEPVTIAVEAVSPGFEETLGVQPFLGRGFEEDDARVGAEPVVLLSHSFWRSAHGGDPGVIGRTIELEGIRHRVIGVMPKDFKFPEYATTHAWVPIDEEGRTLGRRPFSIGYLVARLRVDVPRAAAQERADVHAAALAEAAPREGGWSVALVPVGGVRRGGPEPVRRSTWFLAGAVALIVLAASINALNLLLVRGWSRARELAVRLALGASRPRLVLQLLVESGILALLSGGLAVVFCFLVLWLIKGIVPGNSTFYSPYDFDVEGRTLLFTFVLGLAVALGVGLLPALLSTRVHTTSAGGALTPYAARTPARGRLRRVLVVAEVALSVTLLVGAGLLAHSFVRLVRVDPGFRLDDVAFLTLDLSPSAYPTGEERMEMLRRLEERIEAIPGVVGATAGGGALPNTGITFTNEPETDAGTVSTGGETIRMLQVVAAPDFFELLGVRILEGRAFTPEDEGSDGVILSRALARFLFGDERPVGRSFRPGAEWEWMTVVGVVGDPLLEGPTEHYGNFAFILPPSGRAGYYTSIGIRTTADPRPLFPEIRAAVRELDPRQPVQSLESARAVYAKTMETERFLLVVMAALSAVALLMAALGVYGVLAYEVAQRRYELGVRVALGADPAALARRVLGGGVALASAGAALGVLGGLALSRLVSGLLYGVEPGDPISLVLVVTTTLAAATAASWLPARRTMRIDPAAVLKVD